MDFYTIKTKIDIVSDKDAAKAILWAIGFYSQPLIIGQPQEEDGTFLFRFAVREETLRGVEDDLLAHLIMNIEGFTADNVELIRAARL